MYPLGRQFEVDYTKAKSDKKAIVQGNNYRISVITERVVRLEFSVNGQFNDRPTQLIRRRNVGLPDFSVRQDANIVEISTKYFSLSYIKGQPFFGTKVDPMKNLKITLLAHERDRAKDWYVGHPEARNMYGNMVGVDVQVPPTMQKGLYSLDGFASIDEFFAEDHRRSFSRRKGDFHGDTNRRARAVDAERDIHFLFLAERRQRLPLRHLVLRFS